MSAEMLAPAPAPVVPPEWLCALLYGLAEYQPPAKPSQPRPAKSRTEGRKRQASNQQRVAARPQAT